MTKKWTTLFGLAIAGALMLGVTAQASQIPFAGSLTLTQVGTNSTPQVNFTFNGLTVNSIPGGDTLNGTNVNLTPTTNFTLSGPITEVSGTDFANFTASTGAISIGNVTTGTLSGNVNFIDISQNTVTPGYYNVSMGLSGINITAGTSVFLTSLAGSGNGGEGTLSFSFSSGPQSLSDLLNIGFNSFTSPLLDSVQGTVAVPEPASLALLGTGLLALGFFFKRRITDATGLDLQA